MSSDPDSPVCLWFHAGDQFFTALLAALNAARTSICLECYIFAEGEPGREIREALTRAQLRGVRVQVLVDALGSYELPTAFWEPLRRAGGSVKTFNPIALKRMWIRDHRKLVVCDNHLALIGGFNIAPEYVGDGVTRGWRDLGLSVEGLAAAQLAASFDEMFALAEFRHKFFPRLRKSTAKKIVAGPEARLLFSGPGRGLNPIKRAWRADLKNARHVRILAAYFLPSWRLRRDLIRVAKNGGRVELILAGKSDVRLSQMAGHHLYDRLLKAGVEIFEYQPQVLHAKLLIFDDAVYTGSANLDQRSMQINYELMLRFQDATTARQAREIFAENLKHSQHVDAAAWHTSRNWWQRVLQWLAWWILVRLDPWVARWQWRSLPK